MQAGFSEADACRDAKELLSFCLGKEGLQLLLDFDCAMIQTDADRFDEASGRLAEHEPLAYITGRQDFCGLDVFVLPGVLIPRHDTLVLVEQTLARLQEDKAVQVLELGCGSGAVISALALARPLLQGFAVDVDPLAIRVTRENLNRYNLSERIRLIQCSWFEGIDRKEKFDLILSNPPYISTAEMKDLDTSVKKEPEKALWGGYDGLDPYREILPAAYAALKCGGWCLTEIGWKQGEAVKAMFISAGFCSVEIYRDEGNRNRVVAGCRADAVRDKYGC